ncbi:squalene/phytoene synthase family protein [Oceanibium sediminis]|uniref:squalene/phytoene synthase family protein n=1 Tax=Oceanibium sediminis TaxID=2026339 RepID=UPI000DD445C2|nr:squalene/phytoene synthase family protein [Oceanibium sediminis]
MSIDLCAAQVLRADPDRFRAAMAAPLPGRGALLVLGAFNLEVARAPWVTQEPLIAQMRLQWWRDAVEEIYTGKPPRAHEVVTPLAEVIQSHDLPRALFERIIDARVGDIAREAPASREAVWRYLEQTGGALTTLGAGVLGASEAEAATLGALGTVQAAARLVEALPALQAAGAKPLPESDAPEDQVSQLALEAQDRLADLRTGAHWPVRKALRPALLAGSEAEAILTAARNAPAAALAGDGAVRSEFRKRFTRLRLAATGRF